TECDTTDLLESVRGHFGSIPLFPINIHHKFPRVVYYADAPGSLLIAGCGDSESCCTSPATWRGISGPCSWPAQSFGFSWAAQPIGRAFPPPQRRCCKPFSRPRSRSFPALFCDTVRPVLVRRIRS